MKRRTFLGGAAALGAGAAIDRTIGGGRPADARAAEPAPARPIAFEGEHQAGIVTPSPKRAIFAAFDSIAPNRAELAAALAALSDRARRLTRGYDALLGAEGDRDREAVGSDLRADDPRVRRRTLARGAEQGVVAAGQAACAV